MAFLTNLMPEARFVCRIDGAKDTKNISAAEFASLEPSSIRPVTSIAAWVGKQSYEGRWWFSQTASHIAFASAWERDVLTFLDYRGNISQLARDPAIVIPARSSRNPPMRPWLLTESASVERVLLLPRADLKRGPELAAILEGHSVRVAEVSLPCAEEMRLIRWLAGYRFSRFALPPEVEQRLRGICADVNSVSAAVASAVRILSLEEPAIRANLYSQIWRRAITVINPRAGLSDVSKVVAAWT